ncbi:MAG: TIGR03564 family F420-dependent LLM class oxidoreductase [Myxococcota bacterium]
MRIGLVSRFPTAGLDDVVAEAKDAEARGFQFLSLPNIFGLDAIGALTVVGRETRRIELCTGVVPTPPRHPVAMAQQALTAQAASGGRFVLGIGLSHKIVIEDMFGLSYARPARQMREYLEVLMPLVQGRQASFQGELYRVNAGLQVAGATPVPVVVAALGEGMLRVAGRLADGTATWMTGRKTLASHTAPTIRAAAKNAGRPEPRVIAALPIALTSEPDKAREVASQAFQIYGSLPSYRAMLDREGAASPGDVAIVGDEATLREGLRELADAGVTDFAASVFPADESAVDRTLEFLQAEL